MTCQNFTTCKYMAIPRCSDVRRSFFCGEVLRYQFNYPQTFDINNCEAIPTFRGGDKQR